MEMMTGRTLFRNYKEYDQKEVEICGWVKSNRGSKKFGFLVINDGTFFEPIQVVYDQEMDNFDTVSKLNVGTAVIVNGTVIVTPDAKQPFEIHAKSVEVEGECPSDYPLQKKRHTLEYLRSISHLRPRTNTFQAVFRVRSQIAYAIHKFFQERDFVYVHTPLITGQDCEGAGEMFQVTTMDLNKIAEEGKVDYEQDFFKKPVSLTVSGQLAGETFAQAFRNIYTFGPTFRAEDSNTTRHAAGILQENDVEYKAAVALASEVVSEKAFYPVGQDKVQAAKQLIDSCKKCICAVEEFGPLNEANRELAEYARRIGKTGKNI